MYAIILSVFAVVAILAAVGYALRPANHRSEWNARTAVTDIRNAGRILGSAELHRLGAAR